MDMSFAIQALTAEYLVKNHEKLENRVYPVPRDIDLNVANLKLRGLGLKIDHLSEDQIKYENDWKEGT